MAKSDELLRGANIDRGENFYADAKSVGFERIAKFTGIPVKKVKHFAAYPLSAPGGPLGDIERAERVIRERDKKLAALVIALANSDDKVTCFMRTICGIDSDETSIEALSDDQMFALYVFATEREWSDVREAAGAQIDARRAPGTAVALDEWLADPAVDQQAEAWRRLEMRRFKRTAEPAQPAQPANLTLDR